MSRLWVQLVSAAVLALAWTQLSSLEPRHESGILPIDPPVPFIHYFGGNPPIGRVLVSHGLNASKEVTRLMSAALADGGFEVYAIDLPGHGDSTAIFQADSAEQVLHNARAFLGDQTIVLGHSLSASLLLDLAASESFSTMVLLSPPPVSVPAIHAGRVLIAAGEMDIPLIRKFVPIAADIGSPHVESWTLPLGGHSASLFNPANVRRVVEWLGGDGAKTRTGTRILLICVMFVAAVALGISLLSRQKSHKVEPSDVSVRAILVRYLVACSCALLVLKFANPAGWLRLFATDYLVGFLLVTGVITVAALLPEANAEESRRGVVTAIISAAFVIAVPGLIVVSRVLHMTLSDGRWWRFPFIALAGLPLFLSDELTIRRILPSWKSQAVALLTRCVLLAFILAGVFTFNREKGFLALIAPMIVLFWVGLWFAAGVVHRHTQSPFAAALFAAVVQGWAFAAWFVTI